MIILSQWRDLSLPARVWLNLTAYSFDERELGSIPHVLERSRIGQVRIEDVPKDNVGRMGMQFGLNSEEIERLEKSLDLRFLADRKGDVVIIPGWFSRDEPSPFQALKNRMGRWVPPDKERSYCCHELALHGDGDHSIQITASGDEDALFKCALLGGQRHWFGAKASKGPCRRRPW
jgi:hypothetical protein